MANRESFLGNLRRPFYRNQYDLTISGTLGYPGGSVVRLYPPGRIPGGIECSVVSLYPPRKIHGGIECSTVRL